ncbi:MAG: glycoside hydrolase family 127 protein, partial [Acidobacteria bacterium]|nr:glycoside hydrolase family 127 protein [Acidobacteriota bacterium]
GYVYATERDTLYVNLFAQGSADVTLGSGRRVKLAQQTRYPFEGDVRVTVTPAETGAFTIRVRIPGWARNEPVPSDLYRFAEPSSGAVGLKVNGETVPVALTRGYVTLQRTWEAGDVIELSLPMPVRRVMAHEKVEANRGRVALQRGPLVFAAEWPDNPGGRVRNLVLPDTARLVSEFRAGLLGGVQVVTSRAIALAYGADGRVTTREQEFVAIPYYAWANRGRGQMIVWLPTSEAGAKPTPLPTVATRSTVTTSAGRNPFAINDAEEPAASNDPTSFFSFWPRRGTTEWVEYAFDAPATVSQSEVYWFDDTGRGQTRAPASWRLLYKDGDEWKPVATSDTFGVALDRYNRVAFTPVTTSGLRLEVTLQADVSAGIQEWKVK